MCCCSPYSIITLCALREIFLVHFVVIFLWPQSTRRFAQSSQIFFEEWFFGRAPLKKRVGLFITSPRSFLAAGFPLQSLTRHFQNFIQFLFRVLACKPMSHRVIFCLPPAKNCIGKSFVINLFLIRSSGLGLQSYSNWLWMSRLRPSELLELTFKCHGCLFEWFLYRVSKIVITDSVFTKHYFAYI